jgi:hypothetical protein
MTWNSLKKAVPFKKYSNVIVFGHIKEMYFTESYFIAVDEVGHYPRENRDILNS